MANDDADFRQAVETLAQAMGKSRLMPTPGHVTEVVFRMGAPDAVQALGITRTEASCRPPIGDSLAELVFKPAVEELIKVLLQKTGGTRAQLLTDMLVRMLATELQEFADE